MPISDYTPTVDQVAPLVRARTKDAGGNEIGTFTDQTSPTADQVADLINDAVTEAYPAFGDDIPDNPGDTSRMGYDPDTLRKSATRIVAFRAAALVELTHYPEQVSQQRSAYAQLQSSFETGLKAVAKAISDAGSGDTIGAIDDVPYAMHDGFAVDEGGMVGWNTPF